MYLCWISITIGATVYLNFFNKNQSFIPHAGSAGGNLNFFNLLPLNNVRIYYKILITKNKWLLVLLMYNSWIHHGWRSACGSKTAFIFCSLPLSSTSQWPCESVHEVVQILKNISIFINFTTMGFSILFIYPPSPLNRVIII